MLAPLVAEADWGPEGHLGAQNLARAQVLVFVSVFLHLPGGQFGYVFLSHSHLGVGQK